MIGRLRQLSEPRLRQQAGIEKSQTPVERDILVQWVRIELFFRDLSPYIHNAASTTDTLCNDGFIISGRKIRENCSCSTKLKMKLLTLRGIKKYQEIQPFSSSDKPIMLFFLLINIKMPTDYNIYERGEGGGGEGWDCMLS